MWIVRADVGGLYRSRHLPGDPKDDVRGNGGQQVSAVDLVGPDGRRRLVGEEYVWCW